MSKIYQSNYWIKHVVILSNKQLGHLKCYKPLENCLNGIHIFHLDSFLKNKQTSFETGIIYHSRWISKWNIDVIFLRTCIVHHTQIAGRHGVQNLIFVSNAHLSCIFLTNITTFCCTFKFCGVFYWNRHHWFSSE